MKITKEISIEELTEEVVGSVEYLMKQGIRCIVCGEPIWGTLEEAAIEKGFSQEDITRFVAELNHLASNPPVQKKSQEIIDIKKLDSN